MDINVFIHRRDLRIFDNTSLLKLTKISKNPVLHIFIFNYSQINPELNKYFSKYSFQFLIESLEDLNEQLKGKLSIFYTKEDILILEYLSKKYSINYVAFNKDFTPFAIKRDSEIIEWCKNNKINFISEEDYTLFPLDYIKSGKKEPYKVFTPFYINCLKRQVRHPQEIPKYTILESKLGESLRKNKEILLTDLKGGTINATNRLKLNFKNYTKQRDYPYLDSTTKLSPYLKYGCLSIRQVYFHFRDNKSIVKELFWREFYANITFHFPHILQNQISNKKNSSFKVKYDNIKWKYSKKIWEAFTSGKTGFPMVDAGIRQLLTTGWCHNRSRMIIASFAAKDLHLPFQEIERWFASNLIDYDPSSNSGGIQWAYSIGSDSQPYFRIFNPFAQSKKYDPKCEYILKFVPELKGVSIKDIHSWNLSYSKYKNRINYPKPIVDHNYQARIAKEMFSKIS
ncbi:MAG TPA: deoxyribodipyrimidine photo-lyase [Allocoleopsis sp.]